MLHEQPVFKAYMYRIQNIYALTSKVLYLAIRRPDLYSLDYDTLLLSKLNLYFDAVTLVYNNHATFHKSLIYLINQPSTTTTESMTLHPIQHLIFRHSCLKIFQIERFKVSEIFIHPGLKSFFGQFDHIYCQRMDIFKEDRIG